MSRKMSAVNIDHEIEVIKAQAREEGKARKDARQSRKAASIVLREN
jgi:hypothetical protein